jgi:hypothetical protein
MNNYYGIAHNYGPAAYRSDFAGLSVTQTVACEFGAADPVAETPEGSIFGFVDTGRRHAGGEPSPLPGCPSGTAGPGFGGPVAVPGIGPFDRDEAVVGDPTPSPSPSVAA